MNPYINNVNLANADTGIATTSSDEGTLSYTAIPEVVETTAASEPQFTARQMVDEQLAQFRAQILTLIEALNPYIDDGYPTFTHGAQLVKGNHLLSETLGIIRRDANE